MRTALTLVQSHSTQDQSFDYLSILGRAKAALDSAVEVTIDVALIRPYPNQPRKYFNPLGIKSLANSIAAGGQTTSGIVIYKPEGDTTHELIDGERRWRAISSIPAQHRPLYKAKQIVADDDVVQFLISGVANFNREGHTAIETMETIDRLVGFSFPMEEIASILGISENWAYQIHGLKKLVPEVRALLDPNLPKKKILPVTAAIQISKIEGHYQLGLAERVISKSVTLARLRAEVVKTAKAAGSPIKIREVDPRKKLESLINTARVLDRGVSDLKGMLSDPSLKKYLKGRPVDVRRVQSLLTETRIKILACQEQLK